MSYRKSLYKCRVQYKHGKKTYIVTILSARGGLRDVVVTKEVYDTIEQLVNQDRHLSHQDERHSEYQELSEEELSKRGDAYMPSAEDMALNKLFIEEMKSAFLQLPPAQAKRYLLAHAMGFSYAEIARMEGCSIKAVQKSLIAAKKKLQTILRNGVAETPSEWGKE
jgi:RNA polymerase sigma-70 factor (ECF subfamily)